MALLKDFNSGIAALVATNGLSYVISIAIEIPEPPDTVLLVYLVLLCVFTAAPLIDKNPQRPKTSNDDHFKHRRHTRLR